MNFAMVTLGLKEMGKFLWEGMEKICTVGCLSLVLQNWDSQLGRTFSLSSQRNFPTSFKPKIAIAKFVRKMQKSLVHIMKSGLDAMPLFLLDNLLKAIFLEYIVDWDKQKKL